jgi:Domain of unknown function (DUF6702)
MKFLQIFLLVALLPLILSFTAHKFYVSITKIEFSQEEQSLQIITKLFIDDIEDVLQERYSPAISLDPEKETPKDANFLKEYVLQKLKIKVNGNPVKLIYIGHEYENDVVKSFIEVKNISELKTIEVANKMLMDLFEKQQNIIHIKRYKKRKSLVLDIDNPKGLLNFN